jgi:hypothetical protein
MTPRTKTRLSDQLAEHAASIAAAKQRARAVELERDTAQADAQQLQAQKVDAIAAGDDELAARLDTDRAEAARKAVDLADHITAARLTAKRAEDDRQRFVAENLDALLGEHQQAAQAAVDAVHEALEALQAAHRLWIEAETGSAHLLRLAGQTRQRTPPFPPVLSDLVRRLGRARADVPLPLPDGAGRSAPTRAPEPRGGRESAVR